MSNGMFSSFDVSATGLSAQRRRLDVIAENLANAETTRTPEGGPYRRKRAVFQSISVTQPATRPHRNFVDLVRRHARHMTNKTYERPAEGASQMGVDLGVQDDPAPFRVEYDPGHPDADERGYVLKPNVNVVEEMVDMISATRAYQANAVAFEAAKDMFVVSLEI